jgi:hypothetical protein
MGDPSDIARFRDRCSELMAALLDELATTPDTARTFPEVEEALGWPRRRIASVLGGVSHLRHSEFGGQRPYRFNGDRDSESGRWEIWMDAAQAAAVRVAEPECDPTQPRLRGRSAASQSDPRFAQGRRGADTLVKRTWPTTRT